MRWKQSSFSMQRVLGRCGGSPKVTEFIVDVTVFSGMRRSSEICRMEETDWREEQMERYRSKESRREGCIQYGDSVKYLLQALQRKRWREKVRNVAELPIAPMPFIACDGYFVWKMCQLVVRFHHKRFLLKWVNVLHHKKTHRTGKRKRWRDRKKQRKIEFQRLSLPQ